MHFPFSLFIITTISILLHSCTNEDDSRAEPQIHYFNYTLETSDSIHTYSDEQIGFNICEDFSGGSFTRLNRDSLVVYENMPNAPIGFDRDLQLVHVIRTFTYWKGDENDDLDQFNAFKEAVLGINNRRVAIYYSYYDPEVDKRYFNARINNDYLPELIDANGEEAYTLNLANEFDCRAFPQKLGRINYTYRGYLYTSDGLDSVFVDRLEAEVYTPIAG